MLLSNDKTTGVIMMSIIDRYRQLREQRAYERRIRAFGLPAVIAPYKAGGLVVIPTQRTDERLAAARRAS